MIQKQSNFDILQDVNGKTFFRISANNASEQEAIVFPQGSPDWHNLVREMQFEELRGELLPKCKFSLASIMTMRLVGG